ncbi:TetR/AcrR family transcriptional regulator [Nocardia asteroides]|uniref:TetR/AcrR family transcriptional regulator n=1 Tax=Nocardia asteroides TaxID=1824 RepID=UPI001E45A9E3|nr:TetR/AcrR family transcriptional regulator [Nocardia asteroides]UGT60545.1 TetR/AcrR family transcriptional regulator [Nocardia asteroides]
MTAGRETAESGAPRADATLSTDRRLVAAAERLFAERGIDAVSLRAVMAAAGANVASVHYHFGSKDALVRAVIRARGGEISVRRAELLDAAEASEPAARALADAFVRPVAEAMAAGGGDWVTVVADVITVNHGALRQVTEEFTAQAVRFTELLTRLHPDLPPRTVRFRLTQAMTFTFQTLGDRDRLRDILALSGTHLTAEEVLAELLDTVTAILAGPPDR